VKANNDENINRGNKEPVNESLIEQLVVHSQLRVRRSQLRQADIVRYASVVVQVGIERSRVKCDTVVDF
jgi:hypothetical protein